VLGRGREKVLVIILGMDGVIENRDSLDAGIYRYKLPWLMLIWPLLGLLGLTVSWHSRSNSAIGVSVCVEILMVLVFLEYRTYSVRLGGGTIRAGSCLRTVTFSLRDVKLIQHVYGGRGGQLLYLRGGKSTLLKVSTDLDRFENLLGLMQAYANRHGVEFKTRDRVGTWS